MRDLDMPRLVRDARRASGCEERHDTEDVLCRKLPVVDHPQSVKCQQGSDVKILTDARLRGKTLARAAHRKVAHMEILETYLIVLKTTWAPSSLLRSTALFVRKCT